MAQVVEHILGKDEVTGSSPVISSTIKTPKTHIFMRISGLFLYYFTIKQNPYKTPYTPPKCVKSV
jgi:hypothetical protein